MEFLCKNEPFKSHEKSLIEDYSRECERRLTANYDKKSIIAIRIEELEHELVRLRDEDRLFSNAKAS